MEIGEFGHDSCVLFISDRFFCFFKLDPYLISQKKEWNKLKA